MDGPRVLRASGWRGLLPPLSLLVACAACAVRTAPVLRRDVPRRQVVGLAVALAGIPYAFGGSDIDGFDCSGLVFYVYDCFGIRLPRSAGEQSRLERAIRFKHAEPGDILAFKLKEGWHSAIYIGESRFVHAPNSGERVRIETMSGYWRQRLEAVIAVLPQGR